jgi:hypothetical protein
MPKKKGIVWTSRPLSCPAPLAPLDERIPSYADRRKYLKEINDHPIVYLQCDFASAPPSLKPVPDPQAISHPCTRGEAGWHDAKGQEGGDWESKSLHDQPDRKRTIVDNQRLGVTTGRDAVHKWRISHAAMAHKGRKDGNDVADQPASRSQEAKQRKSEKKEFELSSLRHVRPAHS